MEDQAFEQNNDQENTDQNSNQIETISLQQAFNNFMTQMLPQMI